MGSFTLNIFGHNFGHILTSTSLCIDSLSSETYLLVLTFWQPPSLPILCLRRLWMTILPAKHCGRMAVCRMSFFSFPNFKHTRKYPLRIGASFRTDARMDARTDGRTDGRSDRRGSWNSYLDEKTKKIKKIRALFFKRHLKSLQLRVMNL